MDAFEKWWDSDEAFAFRHNSEETQARAAFIAGLRRAAEIADEHCDPEYVSTIVEAIRAESDKLANEG